MKVHRFLQVRRGTGDRVDRIDFGRMVWRRTIGNDAVLSLGVIQANRLGDLLKQVDDWGTAQTKGPRV